MAKKEKDYTEEQDALFATGKFCAKCAAAVNLAPDPSYQVHPYYGLCDNCGTEDTLPGPALYWNGEEEI